MQHGPTNAEWYFNQCQDKVAEFPQQYSSSSFSPAIKSFNISQFLQLYYTSIFPYIFVLFSRPITCIGLSTCKAQLEIYIAMCCCVYLMSPLRHGAQYIAIGLLTNYLNKEICKKCIVFIIKLQGY